MIPKVIHFCWLSGDKYPELVARCISSWKTMLPDYEIILWNNNRDDIGTFPWVREAFSVKKYAFAADYVRFYALYHYGGIYLDADVEVLRSFDNLLNRCYFLGEECGGDIEAAVMGSEAGQEWIKECLDYYEGRHFILGEGIFDMRPVPLLVNEAVCKNSLEVMPYTYFSPKNYYLGRIDVNSKTYCIHHFDGKWVVRDWKFISKKIIHSFLFCLLGRKGHNALVKRLRYYS